MSASRAGSVGTIDRVVRFSLGVALILMALFCPWAASFGPVMTWGAGAVGAVLVLTAAARFCPLYRMLGVCS